MVRAALIPPRYHVEGTHVRVGTRLGGRRHFVDIVARDSKNRRLLVSLKWQQSSGTAEQKIPFEVMCLADAVERSEGEFDRAYVVLGGHGWTLKEFYVSGGLERFTKNCRRVKILDLESFVAKANRSRI